MSSEFEAKMAEMRAELNPAQESVISCTELDGLQSRMQDLHTAELLSTEELYTFEDSIADYIELEASVGVLTHEMLYSQHTGHAQKNAARVHKLVALSTRMGSDEALARQVRRKLV